MVVSVVEAEEGAVDGAGDALALLVDESRDEGVVMIASAPRAAPPSPTASQRDGEFSSPERDHLQFRLKVCSGTVSKKGGIGSPPGRPLVGTPFRAMTKLGSSKPYSIL